MARSKYYGRTRNAKGKKGKYLFCKKKNREVREILKGRQ